MKKPIILLKKIIGLVIEMERKYFVKIRKNLVLLNYWYFDT